MISRSGANPLHTVAGSFTRIATSLHHRLAFQQPIGVIKTQQRRRSLADFARADDTNTLKPEMLGPKIIARVEQPAETTSTWSKCGYVATLASIAEDTGQGQIRFNCLSAVLLADDMLDLATQKGILLVEQAILAKAVGPLRDQPAEPCGNVATHHHGPGAHEPWPSASGAQVPCNDRALLVRPPRGCLLFRRRSTRQRDPALLEKASRLPRHWAWNRRQ